MATNEGQREYLDGRRFGRLIVQQDLENNRYGNRQVLCRCDCLNYKVVLASSLTSDRTLSCGCYEKERKIERSTKHGKTPRGQPQPREYRIWAGIKQRCLNSNQPMWSLYGGRGISVCERWRLSFQDFFDDMGPMPSRDHSIERVDNDGNYCPENCRWATAREQCRNHRRNRRITIKGVTKTAVEWSEETGLDQSLICYRHKNGWPEERILETARLGKNQFAKGAAQKL